MSEFASIAALSPYELLVGLRYTRARRGAGRNGFISFIAFVSMAGIALGVAALIVVLSVMNGFQDELRTRILSVASHIEIRALDGAMPDWQDVARDRARRTRTCRAAAPYVLGQAMLSAGDANRGALIRGIDPAREDSGRRHRHAHARRLARRPEAGRVRHRARRRARARARRARRRHGAS